MDLRPLWNFGNPAESFATFSSLLAETQDPDGQREIRCQMARALGLQKKFPEGHALLDELVPDLPEVSERVRMSYELERGRLLNSGGNRDEAKGWFERAAVGAEDDLRIDALHMLAIVSEPDEALAWNEMALAQALESPNPAARRWRASLLNNLGWTYHDQENYEKALKTFELAVEVRVEMGDAEGIRIGRWAVARTLRSLGRLSDALSIQQELLMNGPEDGYVHEEIAEILLAEGHRDEAKAHFALAADLLKEDLAEDPARLERMRKLAS